MPLKLKLHLFLYKLFTGHGWEASREYDSEGKIVFDKEFCQCGYLNKNGEWCYEGSGVESKRT